MTAADSLEAGATRERNRAAWHRHLGGNPDLDAVVAALGEGSLPEAFVAAAEAHPRRIALDVEGNAVTYEDLIRRAQTTVGWLAAQGLDRERPVLLVLPTSIELVVAYLACLWLATPVTFVNPASTPAELDQLLARTDADVAIASGPALGHLRPKVRVAVAAEPGSLGRREAAGSDALVPAPCAQTTAIVAFTSGTTGRPKAVPLTHANLLASIRAVMLAWRWHGDDVLIHALPLYHQHGLTGLQASLIAGGTAVVLPRFDPDALCSTIARQRATVLFAVPAIWERLTESPSFATKNLTSLRLAASGSAPLSPALAQRVATVLGGPPLERYGMTESGLDVSNVYDGERRIGSVGWPLPGVEVAIADTNGAPVPDGQDGEVLLRGPQVFGGYLDASDDAGAFHPGGWFRTGDIGRLDPADGCLTLTSRAKELIITGGLNVYPREVELVLEQLDGVQRAAVVGIPSDRWGEEVVAFVVADPATTPEQVIAGARERLSAYKCPKRVVFTEALPTNAIGKIQRDVLARQGVSA